MNIGRFARTAGVTAAAAIALALGTASANAQTFYVDQTVGGFEYKATATFTLINGNEWQIVLTDLSSTTTSNGNTLSALAWNDSSGTEAPVSAALTGGSSLIDNNGNAYSTSDTVANNWGYGAVSVTKGSTTYTKAVAGAGVFNGLGMSNFGNTVNNLDGASWDLANGANGNNGTQIPLVDNSITFVVSGVSANDVVSGVLFQWGTATSEPSFSGSTPVPEGSSGLMLLFGAAPLFGLVRRFRRH